MQYPNVPGNEDTGFPRILIVLLVVIVGGIILVILKGANIL
jgi:uncharacterized integral membrane protein